MNRLVKTFAAVCASVAVTTAANAAPADTDACLASAFELASKASDKKLAEAEQKKVDGMMSKLEGECQAGKFAEAEATMKDISSTVGN